MRTCTALPFDDVNPCGKPATVRLTITGADVPRGIRPGGIPTHYNLDAVDRCALCAAIDDRIAWKYYDGATVTLEPIDVEADA